MPRQRIIESLVGLRMNSVGDDLVADGAVAQSAHAIGDDDGHECGDRSCHESSIVTISMPKSQNRRPSASGQVRSESVTTLRSNPWTSEQTGAARQIIARREHRPHLSRGPIWEPVALPRLELDRRRRLSQPRAHPLRNRKLYGSQPLELARFRSKPADPRLPQVWFHHIPASPPTARNLHSRKS